jgi:hypothetical protein
VVVAVLPAQLLDIEPGAEQPPATGEHHHAQRRVGGQAFEVRLQREQVFAVQPVEVARPVESERGAAGRVE